MNNLLLCEQFKKLFVSSANFAGRLSTMKKPLLPFSVKWLAELPTPTMITFLARVKSLWNNVFLEFLAGFTAPNRQLCLRYFVNDFYTKFEIKINFCFLNERWIYCANILHWKPVNLSSKATLLNANTRALSFLFGSEVVSIFPMNIL